MNDVFAGGARGEPDPAAADQHHAEVDGVHAHLQDSGSRMGVRMTIAAKLHEGAYPKQEQVNEQQYGDFVSVKLRMADAMRSGTCSSVMTFPNIVAIAISMMIIAEVRADSRQQDHKERHVSSL